MYVSCLYVCLPVCACMCLYVTHHENQMWSKSSLHHLTSTWLSQKSLKKEETWEPEAYIVNNAALLSLPRRKVIFWIVILLQEAPWMQQVGFVGLWSRKRLKKNLTQVAFPKKHLHLQPWKTQNFLVKRCNLKRTLDFKKGSDSFDFKDFMSFQIQFACISTKVSTLARSLREIRDELQFRWPAGVGWFRAQC